MGALNILDRNVQPDFMISDAQIFAKAAHESRQIETSEAFKRAHLRWQQRTIEWNVDTIAMGFMDPQNLQAIVAEEERIGIKPVEPTFAPPTSSYAKYGKRDLDKTEEQIYKQQKMAGQVLVAIKNRCKQQVLDHADLILNAPGATPRTKLIAFVKFIEGRRLCDLTVVSIVQDDIKGLNPISTFPDAVDNIIAINLLQEELTLMGQPYSDADLIIQHSNKMPNSDDFRALKMEFIECDVSQFSTSRPTLTHFQPNPLFLRTRKTWDEYCHKVQRYCASEPQNQPQSALSAKMDMSITIPSAPTVLAASTPSDLEATIRKIISEERTPGQKKFMYTQEERDAYRQRRLSAKPPPPPSQPQYLRPQPPRPPYHQQGFQHPIQNQQRPPFQPQRPKVNQDSNPYAPRPSFDQRRPYAPPPSNAERRPQHGNKRAYAAMESQDHEEATYAACEDPAAYGAHQEYGPDGNYDDSYYAMSAAYNNPDDYSNEYDEEEEETYAS